jgi:hypothetical protein
MLVLGFRLENLSALEKTYVCLVGDLFTVDLLGCDTILFLFDYAIKDL